MTKKLISVIIPAFNAANSIINCFNNIKEIDEDLIEYIIIDDGSKDNTIGIVNDFIKDNIINNIHIHRYDNGGVSVARNRGFDHSVGKYVLFLDSDDWYIGGSMATLIYLVKMYNYPVLFEYSRDKNLIMKNKQETQVIDSVTANYMFAYSKEKFHMSAILYCKETINKYNLRFTEGARYGEDWEFSSKYLYHENKVLWLQNKLLVYNDTPGSAMRSISINQFDAIDSARRLTLYDKSEKYLNDIGEYMLDRVIFNLYTTIIKNNRHDLDEKLNKLVNIRLHLRNLLKNKKVNPKIRIVCLSYFVSKNIFKKVSRMKK